MTLFVKIPQNYYTFTSSLISSKWVFKGSHSLKPAVCTWKQAFWSFCPKKKNMCIPTIHFHVQTVDGSEILRSPVEVVSLSHDLLRVWAPSQVVIAVSFREVTQSFSPGNQGSISRPSWLQRVVHASQASFTKTKLAGSIGFSGSGSRAKASDLKGPGAGLKKGWLTEVITIVNNYYSK